MCAASQPKNGAFLMIQRFQAHKFRCFDTLQLDGLRRFNFIVGESGSGKSALLESLFLLSGASPELHFRIRRWRGFGEGNVELLQTSESFSGLFRYLFHNGDTTSIARLSLVDSEWGKRSLDIYFQDKQTLDISLSKPELTAQYIPITFKWDTNAGITNITLEIKDGAIRGSGSVPTHPLHFISSRNLSSRYDALLFSTLSRALRSEELINAVRQIFPSVGDLSLEIVGGETLINAQFTGIKEKIPANELSGGLNKFISIALAIAANPRGIVLVDEIENGFFYRNYFDVIAGLIKLCGLYNVQLFASTHSAEFLEAAGRALEGRPDDFLLLRTKYEQNKCTITKIEGAWSLAAIEQSAEVRG